MFDSVNKITDAGLFSRVKTAENISHGKNFVVKREKYINRISFN